MRHMTNTTPTLVETVQDAFGDGYEVRWYVEPPREGVKHIIDEDSWNETYTVRHVHSWHAA
jgi:hypothetical protein